MKHKADTTQGLAMGLLLFLIAGLALMWAPHKYAIAGTVNRDGSGDDNAVVVGGQVEDVDAEENRDDKFERNRDVPEAAILQELHWSIDLKDGFFQIQGWDWTQLDEGLRARGGIGETYRFRASYQSLPYRYGSGAKFPLGRAGTDSWGPVFRAPDFSQQLFQDPDGDGTQFFTDPDETATDNELVVTMMNNLLEGSGLIGLSSRRRQGDGGVTVRATKNWTFDASARIEVRSGTQALGTGTYQRITDVNGDGITDADHFFSVRGLEIPMPIDYETSRYEASARYRDRRWFANVTAGFSEFDNAYVGLTYDNPFWFDGVEGTSGSRRGLWEEGRASYEPSNETWDLAVTGGVDLPHNTRITSGLSLGEHSQNVPLLPITTNPALIGTKDVNGDGIVDDRDNPTVAAIPGLVSTVDGIPTLGTSLDASSDILSYNLRGTSRPIPELTLKGSYCRYDYEGQEGIMVVPARAEYVESRILTDFKADLILHVPLDWSRETIDFEASYRVNRNMKLKGFGGRKSYDYDQYKDTDDNASRDSGSRAVVGTDDDFYGVTAVFAYEYWLSGRATWENRNRDFSGTYTPGFSGELGSLRQFDIANRDRTSANVHLSFLPTDGASIGFGYRLADDEYPDSEYGLQEAKLTGWSVSFNYTATQDVNLFGFADMSEWDLDMHLRTKCSNCPEPVGAAPWDIPNYDWFSDYKDESIAVGGGVNWQAESKTTLDLSANFVKGQIEQKTANPATPVELNPGNPRFGSVAIVALGADFPTQENQTVSAELKLTRMLNERTSVGIWWRYEDFDLKDFQWNDLDPYGSNFLTIDDGTRYLFLDSRYGDYSAHIVGLFTKFLF